jgi:hypothetical protein
MQNYPPIGIVFIAIGIIFLCITFRDYLKAEGKLTIARKIWLRMAFIFSGVGIGIYFLNNFFH